MKDSRLTRRAGFSLIEMVAATSILSLGVVSICAMSSKGVWQVSRNQSQEIAWDLLDRQLTMIEYVGIDEFMQLGQFEGVFGDESSALGDYRWHVQIEEGDIAGLYTAAIVVTWGPDSHRKSVAAQTLFVGTEVFSEEEQEEEQSESGEAPMGNTGGGGGR